MDIIMWTALHSVSIERINHVPLLCIIDEAPWRDTCIYSLCQKKRTINTEFFVLPLGEVGSKNSNGRLCKWEFYPPPPGGGTNKIKFAFFWHRLEPPVIISHHVHIGSHLAYFFWNNVFDGLPSKPSSILKVYSFYSVPSILKVYSFYSDRMYP